MTAQRGLLDTSVVIAVESGRPVDYGMLPLEQYVCSISIGELHLGVHAAPDTDTRSVRLRTLQSVSNLNVLSVDSVAAAQWGRMRYRLREEGRKINVNDLWIAAVALAHSLPVITQDRDFAILTDLGGPAIINV
ncbi:MAG: type II toxin-antitoxin system VapC family toxin [Homoserinimonas sp.]